MKYTIYVAVVFFIAQNTLSQDFKLKGELKGYKDGTELHLIPMLNNGDADMDNMEIIFLKDGKFECNKHLENSTMFSLNIRPYNPDDVTELEYVLFWAENVPMTLTGEKGNVFAAKVAGSEIQNQYNEYVSEIAQYNFITKHIKDSMITMSDLPEEKIIEMRSRYNNILNQIDTISLDFITSHPEYYCTAHMWMFYIYYKPIIVDKKVLNNYYHQMPEEFRENVYGLQIKDFLDNYEMSAILNVGDYPYDFILADSAGLACKFSDIEAKLILLDFWDSGCGACRREHQNYAQIYQAFKDKGFEIVSVSQDQSKTRWLKAMQKDNMSWVSLWDDDKSVSQRLYNVVGLPTNYLIDTEGKIISKYLRGEKLAEKVYSVIQGGY